GGAIFAPTAQMRYLIGWAEPGHERLIALFVPATGEPALVVPSINVAQARENRAGIADVRAWADAQGWQGVVAELLEAWHLEGRGLAIDDELPSGHLLHIQRLAPNVPYVPAGELMARLRAIKSPEEIVWMEQSAAITDAVYEECLSALREGITEVELQDVIATAYARHGTKPAFAIVCFGPHSALPHHRPGSARLKPGDIVIIDIGCVWEEYFSDMTRTIAYGEPDPEARRVYEIVYAAHRAAFRAIKPGVPCEEVDAAARRVISEAGYGEYFIHRTGHGLGLSEHEAPYIVAGNRQPLHEGMCFSDEPGIYLEGRFGVRIENTVTVTAEGARYLNAKPPEKLPVRG
ncbi:MAG TPA: Xaa-Pro peptidase family protein, partial [Chthonomonadales bacterium]|nr:Xaa-Pro peptidase family protein [Chthonomonadales bacterium]